MLKFSLAGPQSFLESVGMWYVVVSATFVFRKILAPARNQQTSEDKVIDLIGSSVCDWQYQQLQCIMYVLTPVREPSTQQVLAYTD
jgi:hypothetical protein